MEVVDHLRKAEAEIFDAWRAQSLFPERVVADGVIDAAKWLSSAHKRILFVLRDKNGNVSASYQNDCEYPNNFRKELAEIGSGGRTWNNAARWGQALLNPALSYEEVKFMSGARRGALLSDFAVINLRKEYGGARTDRTALDLLPQDQTAVTLLQRQIALYAPDIILACGMRAKGHKSNLEIIMELYGIALSKLQTAVIRGRSYRYIMLPFCEKEIPVIEFYHPQVTFASAFAGLKGHALWEEMFADIKALGVLFDISVDA